MVGALEMVGDVEGSIEGSSVGESVGDTLLFRETSLWSGKVRHKVYQIKKKDRPV